MSVTVQQFLDVLSTMGSDVVYHRESGGTDCPCLSAEGFRSPAWHKAHPDEPVCNEDGKLNPTIIDLAVKASIQPYRMTRTSERLVEMFGEVQADDQIGFFPVIWQGVTLNFYDWNDSAADYILHDGRRFLPVNADKLPDIDGDPNHHWEIALRLIKTDRPV